MSSVNYLPACLMSWQYWRATHIAFSEFNLLSGCLILRYLFERMRSEKGRLMNGGIVHARG